MSNERSESEENISGFESDEGPMMAVHKAKERVLGKCMLDWVCAGGGAELRRSSREPVPWVRVYWIGTP